MAPPRVSGHRKDPLMRAAGAFRYFSTFERLPRQRTGGHQRVLLTNLLWKVLQQILPQTEVGQVDEVANASGQRSQLIIGQHQFLEKSQSARKH